MSDSSFLNDRLAFMNMDSKVMARLRGIKSLVMPPPRQGVPDFGIIR